MDLFEINKDTCIQDGICMEICPSGLIDFQKGRYPEPIARADELCLSCGHCVAACPTGSLRHREMTPEQCLPFQKELVLNSDHCEHFLRARRSIRRFQDKPVPRKDIQRLIEIARYAPSGSNTQSVEWLVLGNRDEIRGYAELVADWMRMVLERMPELAMAINADHKLWLWDKGRKDTLLRDAPVIIVTHAHKDNRMALSNCTIALSYLDLAATSMGLGCCWAGFFHVAATTFPPMMEVLPLPDNHQCFGAIMVGYPKFSYHRMPTRKTPRITWQL